MYLSALSRHFLTTNRLDAMTTSLGSLLWCLTTHSVKNLFLISNLNFPWCLDDSERKRTIGATGKKMTRSTVQWKLPAGHSGTQLGGSYTNYSDGNSRFMSKLPPEALQSWAGGRYGLTRRSMYLCPESCVPFNSTAHREWSVALMKVTCSADTWMTELSVRWRPPCFTLFPC